MSRRYYNLPPLTTLAAFETAARHLSFKNAAQELSVTPGAVSHQIKALEGELGVALFQRKHRGVELTPDGEDLFQTLATAFVKVSQNLQNIRNNSSVDTVSVGATSAVASLWLTPAITRFWREHGDINVNQIVNDRGFGAVQDLDFYFRYGRDRDPLLAQTVLYRDNLVPVAHPELARQLMGAPLEHLAQQRLIHLVADDRSWTLWPDWFAQLGYNGPIAPGVRVNNYSIALQAAEDGAGLVLGWQKLVSPLLRNHRLMQIEPHILEAPHRFYIVSKEEDKLSPTARVLRDWLLADAKITSV